MTLWVTPLKSFLPGPRPASLEFRHAAFNYSTRGIKVSLGSFSNRTAKGNDFDDAKIAGTVFTESSLLRSSPPFVESSLLRTSWGGLPPPPPPPTPLLSCRMRFQSLTHPLLNDHFLEHHGGGCRRPNPPADFPNVYKA